MTRVSVPAIKCNQNGRLFYVAVLSSDILKEMCFVSRKKEEPIKGFQRLLNQRRASDIASYLDDSKGVIPSSLILSAQDNANIRFNDNNNSLSFEVVRDSLMVIDGQHRLYGLLQAHKTYKIPVAGKLCL